MKPLSQYIDQDKISYCDQGESDATVILLHGNSLAAESFKAQFTDTELSPMRLLAIDLPGHGHSSPAADPEHTYNLFTFRDIVIEIIQKLNIGPFVFAGHSLGGHVAMECLPFLSGCRGVFLWGAPPVKLPLDTSVLYKPSQEVGLLFTRDLDQSSVDALASLLACKDHQRVVAAMIAATDPAFRQFLPASLAEGKVSDEYQLLCDSKLPVALIQGKHDALINLAYLQQLQLPHLWRDEVVIIDDACHAPQLETPREFNSLLKEFVIDCNRYGTK